MQFKTLFAYLTCFVTLAAASPYWGNWNDIQTAQTGIMNQINQLQGMLGNVNIPDDQKRVIMDQINQIMTNNQGWVNQRNDWGRMIDQMRENYNTQYTQLQGMLNQWNLTPEQRQSILEQMNNLTKSLNDNIQNIMGSIGYHR